MGCQHQCSKKWAHYGLGTMVNHMSPNFTFALSPEGPSLTARSDLWTAPVPGSRHAVGRSPEVRSPASAMTYGDYFTAARQFLSLDRCRLLRDAVGKTAGRVVAPGELRQVSVCLVKYGAFYHPAYVVAQVGGSTFPFVLNVAVSSNGRQMIAGEYRSLTCLNTRFGTSFWPRVFGLGEGRDLDSRSVPMFLGQWLEGYYEFHLSGETPDQRRVVMWDSVRGHRLLSREQVSSCLGLAARILTHAYNPLTFEAIRHWHPAAGDFVAATDEKEIGVKLITVRDYAPIIEHRQPDIAAMLEGLLLYLMEISLKLRLDRLDGVGRIVCHSRQVVPAICDGFFQGVASAAPYYDLPGDFDATVREFIALHDHEQLRSVASVIVRNSVAGEGERDLLKRKMKRHLAALASAIQP